MFQPPAPVHDLRDFYPEQQKEVSHEEHKHEWTFIRELELITNGSKPYKAARFICHCGAYKQPKLKEVES
jgi:hypothetical protein